MSIFSSFFHSYDKILLRAEDAGAAARELLGKKLIWSPCYRYVAPLGHDLYCNAYHLCFFASSIGIGATKYLALNDLTARVKFLAVHQSKNITSINEEKLASVLFPLVLYSVTKPGHSKRIELK